MTNFTNKELDQILESINKAQSINVLCIGDVMLDKFVYGTVNRISPEAPVPIFLKKNEKCMLGGAGNVASNISSLGCNTTFLGVVGADKASCSLSQLFKESNIKCHLFKVKELTTIIKTRIISANQHLLRIDSEEPYKIPISLIPRITVLLKKLLNNQNIVILSDYNKGIFSLETCQTVIKLCNQMNIKVIVDPKGNNYEKYRGVFLVKPNLKEFSEVTGISKIDPLSEDFFEKIVVGAKYIFTKYDIKNLVVTLSEHGMIYINRKSDQIFHIPTIAKEVYDVSGAGDTSIATLALGLATDLDIKLVVSLANIASGLVVSKLGTSSVNSHELLQAAKSLSLKYV